MKQKNFLKIAFFFLLFSGISYGQEILTFEFSALDGNETTAASNSNDANIGSSTISRGAGLTASSNRGRFNATSWATTSIDNAVSGDDYMEFTITPNAIFQFSVSSITINLQRSGTGPSTVALRSSFDNYATNLDGEKVIIDNTSTQSFTFTFAQANSTTAVTYRFYMYAESTSGSGGIGDGTGNDIIVNGTVTAASSDPVISFDAATSTENETDATFTSANIPISVINYSGSQIDINVSVTGGTSEIGDYTFTSPTSLSFTGNGTQNITVDINDDADYDDETLILTITETSSVTGLIISQDTHTITILDDDIAPNFEDFTNSNATSSYSDNSFLGNNGITWTYVASRDENGDANTSGIDGNALMLRRVSDGSKVTSSTITGGIQNFSVKLYKGFTGAGDRQVELFINNISFGSSTAFDDFTEQTFSVNNINVTGDFTIEIRNIQSGQIIVDDISWSSFNPSTVTWDGSDSTDWATAANWDTNAVPKAGDNVVIADVTNKPIISSSTNAETNDLTINGSATVTVSSNGTLRVYGTSTGNVTYNRNLGTENWYLVSSPVSGETYDDAYVTANNLAINGTNNAIATYTTADNTWSYMQTGGGATFTTGIGYSVKRETGQGAGDISFTGTINTSDVSVGVVTGVTTSFNLLGNPFTSYVNSASFLTDNSANLVSETIWVWNQATNNYETKVTADNFVLAPAQGFFVNASSATNLTIAKSYQASSGNAFQKTSKTEVKLMINDGVANRFAKIYYLSNATTGFDNGYDGETFGGIANSIDVFTNLLYDNLGKKYQVQSLPNSDYENMVIPVGVIAEAGKKITFSTDALNLPTGVKVFLEDRVTGTITRLDEANSEYKVTLSEKLDGVGRFYLHTKSSAVLSTDDLALQGVQIFASTNRTLEVTGVNSTKATLKLYNILGKQVMQTTFSSTGKSTLNLPNLSTGVYIVQLSTDKGQLNKKIVLE